MDNLRLPTCGASATIDLPSVMALLGCAVSEVGKLGNGAVASGLLQ